MSLTCSKDVHHITPGRQQKPAIPGSPQQFLYQHKVFGDDIGMTDEFPHDSDTDHHAATGSSAC